MSPKATPKRRMISNFSAYLDPELIAKLQAIKERDGIPLTVQVRKALERWIEEHQQRRKR